MNRSSAPAIEAAAAVAGTLLGAALTAYGRLRRDRPLHAVGTAYAGVLESLPSALRTGVPLLDDAARRDVVARVSRAGSPWRTGPAVWGLALRIAGATVDGVDADLLLASTGLSRRGRHIPAVRRRAEDGPLSTILTWCSPTGPLMIAAREQADASWSLAWSRPGEPAWHPWGRLTLGLPAADPGAFDPTGRPPAGLRPSRAERLLRAQAYAGARAIVARRRYPFTEPAEIPSMK